MVETIVALMILAVVFTAAVPFIISVLRTTGGLNTKQTALAVASQQLEYIRSVDPAKLVTGRNAQDVANLIQNPGLVVLTSDVTSGTNSDPAASVGSAAAAVPPVTTQTLNGTTYTIRSYIDQCYLSKLLGTCNTSILNGPAAYRVSVDVAWPRAPGVNCPSGRSGQCEYVSTTLVDLSQDPLFSTNTLPSIASLLQVDNGLSSPLTTLHPGQSVGITLLGTFAFGATVYSSGGDAIGPVSNTGSTISTTVTASTLVGTRALSVINPDGGSATTTFSVATSTPTILLLTPVRVVRGAPTTFTLTGTDFLATPTVATPTAQPTIALAGATIATVTSVVSPTTSAVTVLSPISLTFRATFPDLGPYATAGTLTLTNPDGGQATYRYTLGVL